MSRQLRLQFPGAHYHVTARGNNRQLIVLNERDVATFLNNLEATCERYAWRVFGWCIMPNHYHLVLQTARETLSAGMRRLNSMYAQQFNRRYQRVGHVFQGRFKAFVVADERYLFTVLRYVELNPCRAALVQDPIDWPWSSVRISLGLAPVPRWSAASEIWARFGSIESASIARYREFLLDGLGNLAASPPVQRSLVIGDEAAASDVYARARHARISSEIPRLQRTAPMSLDAIFAREPDADMAIKHAYAVGFTLRAIGEYLGVHCSTVSTIARRTTPRKRGSSVALRAISRSVKPDAR